jgi:predicted metal-dependent phosphotriesterase family hydrolase
MTAGPATTGPHKFGTVRTVGLGRNPRGVARISLPRRFLPRLRDRLGSEVVDRLLIENPARLLTLRAAQ